MTGRTHDFDKENKRQYIPLWGKSLARDDQGDQRIILKRV
jgi:hypothetical protein